MYLINGLLEVCLGGWGLHGRDEQDFDALDREAAFVIFLMKVGLHEYV